MKGKTFDLEGLVRHLRDGIDFQHQEMMMAKQNADKFFAGYQKAIWDVIHILDASNYEIEKPAKDNCEEIPKNEKKQ